MADIFVQLRNDMQAGEVLTPDSPGYKESLVRWSSAAVKPARVVVRPTSADEVSRAIKFATANKIHLAVCGGGHSSSGASSSDGGMVMDLALVNQVDVDPVGKTVTFGGGCRWKQVDAALAEHGLATVGGTVNDTGVGGLTLGGGFGWLSPRHGLAIDNLLAVEVVLADGRILQASKTENTDLFWAVRGAGQNFGVVTKFVSQAHLQGDYWGGIVIFPLDKLADLVEFTNQFLATESGDAAYFFGPTHGLPGMPGPVVLANLSYNGAKEEAERVYKPLFDLGPLANMTRAMPYPEINGQLPTQDYHLRRLQGGTNFTLPLDPKLVTEATREFLGFAQDKALEGVNVLLFEIIPQKKIREVQPDETAFSARGDYYHISTLLTWTDEKLDGEVRMFNRKIVKALRDKGTKDAVGQYNNYDVDHLNPTVAWGDNLERLRGLKKKYDPNNVFWKWHGFWTES